LYDGVIVEVEPQAPHRVVSIAPGPAPTFQPPTMPTGAARMAGVEALLKRLSEADVFSGVVLIAENGRPIFQQAYGYADREKRVPNTMNTRFRLASLNKIFTGLAIGRLVEQGKLSYEDPLSKFIPDYPDPESARRIRIKHLLSHTSGLGTYFNQEFFRNIETMTDMPSVMAVAGRQPPEFEPGTKHRYSNVGFHLLGRVIEQVTGEDYYAHMERTMFRPLGLGATGFPHFDRAGAGVALPYETRTGRDGRIELAVPDGRTRRGGPAGDAASSAPDLLRFANALQAGEVVSPETLRLHSTPKPELGAPRYGYGMTQPRIPFRSYYGHGGDAPGSCTDLAITRDTPYTVIVLSNSSAGSCRAVVEKILVSFWPDKAAPPRRGAGG
jgi:CubicO group peptidase (beta-lactamase class C family)